ncbi:MAG: GTP-binding protein [Thermoprotei archaeon]|nr:MAG: GTP-binding protein [Thermoprotei archaeon]RLE97123.1 MAG: GTP-binding protein [Thermoprotei archaeon]
MALRSRRDPWLLVKRVVKEADVVVEVVDARDPMATRSRELEALVERLGKRLVIVINKADLVPREVLEEWKEVLSREYPTIYLSARERLGTRWLWRIIKQVVDKRPVTIAVVGLPNVGKSTILNVLKGRHSASTSPIPGWTRVHMKARAATWLRVVDTPGVVPRGSEDELAIRGALRPEALSDPIPTAVKLINMLRRKDPGVFERCYGISGDDPLSLLESLARRRGLLLKGGELNVEEAARILIRDWQTGRIVVYFTPEDYGLKPSRSLMKGSAPRGSSGNSSSTSLSAPSRPPRS